MEDYKYTACWLPPELVKPVDFVSGKLKSVAPGTQVMLSICAGNFQYLAPQIIRIACFASDGDLVANPLQRLPALLRAVSIRGSYMVDPTNGRGIIAGYPEDPEYTADDEPDPEDDSYKYIFRNISPWPVNWSVFGQRDLAQDIQLTFENINTVPVHIFARIDGEVLPTWNHESYNGRQ
jgi:hypothetical protein